MYKNTPRVRKKAMSNKRNLDEMQSSDESVPDLIECTSCSSDEVCKKFKGLPTKEHLSDDDSTVAYGFSDDEYFQQIYAEEDARIARGSDESDDDYPSMEYDPEIAEANLPNIPLWPGADDSDNDPMQMPLDPPEFDDHNYSYSWSTSDNDENVPPTQHVHEYSGDETCSASESDEPVEPAQAPAENSDDETPSTGHNSDDDSDFQLSPLYQNQLEDPRVQALQDNMFNGKK